MGYCHGLYGISIKPPESGTGVEGFAKEIPWFLPIFGQQYFNSFPNKKIAKQNFGGKFEIFLLAKKRSLVQERFLVRKLADKTLRLKHINSPSFSMKLPSQLYIFIPGYAKTSKEVIN